MKVTVDEPRPLTYQARCAMQAIKQAAYGLGALALGHSSKAAALHFAAATAWGALSASVATAVKLGLKQELIDALWIEPFDPMLIDGDDTDAN